MTESRNESGPGDLPGVGPIAVVGMACRVPGAGDVREFWRNLVDGVESVTFTSREEQLATGLPPEEVDDPAFVPAVANLDDLDKLDHTLFGMSKREAEVTDPQYRLFLELAHSALEDGGVDPSRYPGDIAVYGSAGEETYHWEHVKRNSSIWRSSGASLSHVGNGPDYLATSVSYRLGLRGPAMSVHTACSSSGVAIHLACEALRNAECDMALAGGVSIEFPIGAGYLFLEGSPESPDGHVRPFDADAGGTLWASGGGVVLLKRLDAALADGDTVHAVILGNAVNNDGNVKVSFSAPSQEGQATAVQQALAVADVDPRTVSYVEAHGTGTLMGDPIEFAALNDVFRRGSTDVGWCALGSVKSNVGHLSQGSCVIGLIKTALALTHQVIPPSLNYERPNPAIDIETSPFRLNSTLSKWTADGAPRRAGVSSFGFGGTNVHLVLQEAPEPRITAAREPHLLQVSARTETALRAATARLARHLTDDPTLDLGDVAYTLRTGRREHAYRAAVVVADAADAVAGLNQARRLLRGTAGPARVGFLFPGQGSQSPGMGARLYQREPVFAAAVDECADLLRPHLEVDIREVAFDPDRADLLAQTRYTQPAVFVVDYALALLWRSWGVEPAAMVGHSVGEYVAATLAGVFRLPDALRLVAARGELMQSLPPGRMLAVGLGEAEVTPMLPAGLTVATVNAPGSCVVAGPPEAVEEFARRLRADEVSAKQLRTSHAFHSAMVDPILPDFRAVVASVPMRAPTLRYLSDVTGDWITDAQATDPDYWTRHLREPVRFDACLATLREDGPWALVECGPGRQLAGQSRRQLAEGSPAPVQSLPGQGDKATDEEMLYGAAGRLWVSGVSLAPEACGGVARRVSLPHYPYERIRHWVDPDPQPERVATPTSALASETAATTVADAGVEPAGGLDDWFSVPGWRLATAPAGRPALPGRCVVLSPASGAAGLADRLLAMGVDVHEVVAGASFGRDERGRHVLRPDRAEDYDALIAALAVDGLPERFVHAFAAGDAVDPTDAVAVTEAQRTGFHSLLALVRALAAVEPERVHLDVVTIGTQDVVGGDLTRPEHATVVGVTKVAPNELAWLSARHVDVAADEPDPVSAVLAELGRPATDPQVAVRRGRRWVPDHRPVAVEPTDPYGAGLREGGVYLVLGGTGGIGITVAEALAGQARARLVLVSRTALPPRAAWDAHLAEHGDRDRTGRAMAAIRRMEEHGAEVLTLAADVTDETALRRVRAATLDRFGRLDGILHAAGLPGGGMIEVRSAAAADAVLGPKVTGTVALRRVFADLPLDFVVLCSSDAAVAGDLGQVDYCAANLFKDAYARWATDWARRVVSVNFGGWLEVGMAAEIPDPTRPAGEPFGHPVLDTRYPVPGGLPWYGGTLSASTHWLLDEHRSDGRPLLPGVTYLESVRAAFVDAVAPPPGDHVVELTDVVFVQPLTLPEGSAAQVRVQFVRESGEALRFHVSSSLGRTHAQGTVRWLPAGEPPRLDLDAIRGRCPTVVGNFTEEELASSGWFQLGPHWRNIREVHHGDGPDKLALLEMPDVVRAELDRMPLHPSVLDEATAFGKSPTMGGCVPMGYGRLVIRSPLTPRLWVHLRLDESAGDSYFNGDVTLVDDNGVELAAATDFLMRVVDGRTLDQALGGPAAEVAPPPPVPVGAAPAYGIPPADGVEALYRVIAHDLGPQVVVSATPLAQLLRRGGRTLREMRPAPAVPAPRPAPARPAVARPAPAAVPAPAAPPARTAPTPAPVTTTASARSAPTAPPAPTAASPASSASAAPAAVAAADTGDDDTAARLLRLWSEVLGVDEIGLDDDFFELGGNSLVAVQLIAQVRKVAGVKLPMRTLFDASTVRDMVANVEKARAAKPARNAAGIPKVARGDG
ncbi:type I polyketide synthase [Micromonospora sediminicola]|uniref:type I polyketide synthase n=1 Tax=Micromonospora sediminicola TaxID=946078 RepID=UPI0033E6ECEE